jgi:hypothetical protein
MTLMKKLGLIATLGAFLTGCSTQRENMRVNHTCFDAPSSVVIARIEGFEKAGYHKAGQQGLLDSAIISAVSSTMIDKIESIDTKPLLEKGYYNPFDKFFSQKGYKVVKEYTPLSKKDLKDHEKNEKGFSLYDLRNLATKYHVEYALLLEPHQFGVEREYYGFIPLRAPKGSARFTVSFIRLRDGALMAHYNAVALKNVIGEWDAPPAYEALTASIRTALINSLDDAHEHMFGDDLDMDGELDLK